MSKARTLANFVSAGNPLSDGTIAASELTGTLAVANGGTGQTTYTDGQVLIGNTTGNTLTKASLTAGTGITITPGAGSISIAANNAGTVTSVTGTSPVASSGGATPAISLSSGYGDTLNPYASKTANFVLAAPNGSAGVPTFRAVDAADIPTLNQNTTGNAATATSATSATNLAGGSNGTIPYQTASGTTAMLAVGTAGQLLQTNGAGAPTWITPASGALAAKTCTFDASGTWTKPSGYGCSARVYIQAWGGGGSGYRNSCGGGGGGGGGYNYRCISIACLSSTVTVTIGAGGTASSTSAGVTGGTTTFGSYVSAYGGGRGTCTNFGGGGGGGQLSAGANNGESGNPFGGTPFYVAASTKWVVTEGAGATSSGSSAILTAPTSGYYKGGGGGGGYTAQTNGANSVWGGGGGGGTAGASSTGGTSSYGGNGGGGRGSTNGIAGTQPAGGGGGTTCGSLSGAGGAGRVIVTVYAGV